MDGGSEVPTDDELSALAMAADPHAPPDPDAVPIDRYLGGLAGTEPDWCTLPDWYMPPVTARRSGRARRVVILSVVGAFLLIEAFGLCSTYGQLPFH